MGARYILALVLMIAVMIAWSLFLAPKPNEIPPTEEAPRSIRHRRNAN